MLLGLSLNVLASWVVAPCGPWQQGSASVVILAGLLIWFHLGTTRIGRLTDPVVAENKEAPKVKVLVQFLSLPRNTQVLTVWMEDPSFQGAICKQGVYDVMGSENWRMPFEAIRHHEGELEKVVLIPSADKGGIVGTWALVGQFRDLFQLLMRGRPKPGEVVSAFELTKDPQWEHGVDFENAQKLAAALASVQRELAAKYGRRDIIIDITGGQKVPAAVAAAIALGRDQLIQYVSTHDKEVHCYDITYRPAE
jgi:hypothetical protein